MSEQHHKILQEFSGAAFNPDYCRDEFLHELFENNAERYSSKTALECGNVKLTYRELDKRSNQLAYYLRKQGLQTGDNVVLMLDKTEYLYIAMIGVMKAGAAYVPVDLSFPVERVDFILKDSAAPICITTAKLWEAVGNQISGFLVQTLLVDQDWSVVAKESEQRLLPETIGLNREALFSPCYIIYTSGTTGRPKGCIIDHRNICNYVRGATATYGIKPEDRILQCASIAFDASLEEIWMAFANGGTLIAGTKEIMQSGPQFGEMMTCHNVTVLSCSPTLLSMVESEMDTIRIIILGGEACPHDLVKRWYNPNRVLFNSYGPTETTIVATVGELRPDKPVTIGRALPNYRTYIVNEKLELVPIGEEGELLIAGPGVSRGYLNMDDLDFRRFIFTNKLTGEPLCLYRTGDLARYNSEGEIEYLGRSDDQVKLRGFRIELSEIESILMQNPAILSAAVALHHTGQQLAAYVVIREGHTIKYKELRETLKKRLPPYMIPSWLDEVESLPTSSSGKINRKQLPAAQHPFVDEQRQINGPCTPVEEQIVAVWRDVFPNIEISTNDDFFYDLGGHSLLAAGAVSKLRKIDKFKGIAVRDIYKYPTIESLAKFLQALDQPRPLKGKKEFHKASGFAYFCCAIAQGAAILIHSLLNFWQWLGPFMLFAHFSAHGMDAIQAAFIGLLVYAGSIPVIFAIVVLAKWLIIGKIRPGSYPLWGWYYFRYWFIRQLIRAIPINFLAGSPVLPIFYRLMGAKIGKGVYFGSYDLTAFDLLTVGNGSSIGTDSSVNGSWVEGGMLHLAPIQIGENCKIGSRAILAGNNIMEDGAALGDISLLPEGVNIPGNELWSGSPAQFTTLIHVAEKREITWSFYHVILFAIGAVLLPTLIEGLFFPGLIFVEEVLILSDGLGWWFIYAPFLALIFILLLLVTTTLLKKVLCFDMKESRYPLNSFFYFRYWLFSQLFRYVETVLGGLFGTIYTRQWLLTLGVRLGPGTEVSYVRDIIPEMLEVGKGCFIADDASINGSTIDGGYLYLKKTCIGDYTFIGNSAVVPAGTRIGSHCLIGVLSTVSSQSPIPDGTAWLGSPPIFLPKRQKLEQFGEEQTFKPKKALVLQRCIIDFFKIILPTTIFIILACIIIDLTLTYSAESSTWYLIALTPFIYILSGIVCILVFAGFKRLLVGRYKPGVHPLWSPFVWVSELITGVYEGLIVNFFYNSLLGTPYVSRVLRLFGVKIGNRCYIDTSWMTEFDLIEIGDDVALNDDANLQTHLFEDRIMKLGKIQIGDRCTVGAAATILYDVQLEAGVGVSDLTLIMKGETMPAHTDWQGVPGQRMR
ncbi:Pls/PosA family non-ribosomal peptide synthetase [Sporomusa malonica]|uniref:Carrier domain-containing protein n=1 Tax=Sporomusa malonica TaxID=112901 RepID=A0A1W2C3C2_9FIRM|nr:Pls/PosA family non-ribosomal peptide synthetase [Sporomusa malonica]SMC79747.1 non-ribosomal peptide synthetase terminal domain of unknown function [Sporomusa malonica]